MNTNFLAVAVAAIVPMILGAIWYGPLFKNVWMKEMNFTEESMKGANMPLIFGVSYILSFLLAFALQMIVIHQWGIFSTLAGEPGFNEKTGEAYTKFTNMMNSYGDRFRTFKHGTLHGMLTGLFIVMPIIAIKALFERKSFKYIAINAGYWIITLAIMGGIICQWA